jgi:hypothetical protein
MAAEHWWSRLRPRLRPECTCRPSDGYHQYKCAISQRMRSEIIEAGKPVERIDPTKRAKAT